MKAPEIIKDIIANSHPRKSYEVMAKELGYKTYTGITNRLNKGDMSVNMFFKLANYLGYEIVVRPKTTKALGDDSYRVVYVKEVKDSDSE